MVSGKKTVRIPARLVNDVRAIIESARDDVARTVNSAQVLLYWDLGSRINQEILKQKRAEYGVEIVQTLSTQLEREFGRGFSKQNVHRMIQTAQVFPDREKVSTLSRQLSWGH